MKRYAGACCLLLVVLLFAVQADFKVIAAPPAVVAKIEAGAVKNVRVSQAPDKLRIVIDLDKLPEYKVTASEDKLKIALELPATVNKSVIPQIVFNDPVVDKIRFLADEPGKLKAVLDLKVASQYRVTKLYSPNRIIVDIIKIFEQKLEEQVVLGIKYTFWRRGSAFGPVTAYIADIDSKAGYTLKPVLFQRSNDRLGKGVRYDPAYRRNYRGKRILFQSEWEILVLLKMNGHLISAPSIIRSAWGLMPDGRSIIDQVEYHGTVELPGGQTVVISGLNCERGSNELVLYTDVYGQSTATNGFGTDYIIIDGKVAEINIRGNSTIAPGRMVLSAHGEAAAKLSCLAVGDTVKLTQTLGGEWDKTLHAIGAGPTLVKEGKVFITTKTEEFGSDVAGGRAPRTALGITAKGHILLVVIDGRQEHSIGLSLFELAEFMLKLGAVDAINLDGGGSSTMLVNGRIVNKPSDKHERKVGDAIIVIPAQLKN